MSAPTDQTSIAYVPAIGRRARTDSWEHQKVSTYRMIRGAAPPWRSRRDGVRDPGRPFRDPLAAAANYSRCRLETNRSPWVSNSL